MMTYETIRSLFYCKKGTSDGVGVYAGRTMPEIHPSIKIFFHWYFCERGEEMAAKQITKMINGKLCLSTAAMTETLGISQQTLSFWESQGCPKEARGWWSIKDILEWKGVLSALGIKTEEDNNKVSWNQKKLEAEAKFKQEKAKEAEFKNDIAEGNYIRKEEITSQLQRLFTVLKRSLNGFSRRIATELAAYLDPITTRKIEKMIAEMTADALEQLSIDGVYKTPKKSKD